VLTEAVESVGRRACRIDHNRRGARPDSRTPRSNGRPNDDVVVLVLDGVSPEERVDRLAEVLKPPAAPRTVVIVVDDDIGSPPGQYPHRVEVVLVEPLRPTELVDLVEAVVGATPHRALLDHVKHVSAGLAGRVVRETESLLMAGRVSWIPDGVTLVDAGTAERLPGEIRSLLDSAVAQAESATLDVIQMLACLDESVSLEQLLALLNESGDASRQLTIDQLRSVCERLTDLGLLRVVGGGLDFHSAAVRTAATAWM